MSNDIKPLVTAFEATIKDLTDRIVALEEFETARQETIKKHKPISVQFATVNKRLDWLNKHLIRLMGKEIPKKTNGKIKEPDNANPNT